MNIIKKPNRILILAFVIFFTIPLSSAVSTTVVISPVGAGTVTVTSPVGTKIVTSSATITVLSGSMVTYRATPKSGFAFNRFVDVWGKKSATSTLNPWTDSVSSNDKVTAVFIPVPTINTGVTRPTPTPSINTGPTQPTPTPSRTISIGGKLITNFRYWSVPIFYK
ncbi:MAG: hypothetical protein OIN86_04740 [Candidatus Methanoperedens sp.]|nr:hypothetical protein [Candidatus Methanoperedens sp.]CAG0997006.1 hypothetical protein METP1_02632 [Methanosarcinales archaeon]